MKKINFILLLTVFTFLFTGCGKDGDPGPQGVAGMNGADGNANVTSYSYTILGWGYDASANYHYSEVDQSDGLTILTSSVINSGSALLAYIETSSGWTALPYLSPIGTGELEHYRPFFEVDHFQITVKRTDGSNVSPQLSAPRNVKIVVIPHQRINPNVDVRNYNDVMTAYKLHE